MATLIEVHQRLNISIFKKSRIRVCVSEIFLVIINNILDATKKCPRLTILIKKSVKLFMKKAGWCKVSFD